jgi:hypothetical protein
VCGDIYLAYSQNYVVFVLGRTDYIIRERHGIERVIHQVVLIFGDTELEKGRELLTRLPGNRIFNHRAFHPQPAFTSSL